MKGWQKILIGMKNGSPHKNYYVTQYRLTNIMDSDTYTHTKTLKLSL